MQNFWSFISSLSLLPCLNTSGLTRWAGCVWGGCCLLVCFGSVQTYRQFTLYTSDVMFLWPLATLLMCSCRLFSFSPATSHPGDLQWGPWRDPHAHLQVGRHQCFGKNFYTHTLASGFTVVFADSSWLPNYLCRASLITLIIRFSVSTFISALTVFCPGASRKDVNSSI